MKISATWKLTDHDSLEKTVEFATFKEALHFINEVGQAAEELNHHPDICLRNYSEVFISLTTHHVGSKLTDADYALAEKIDAIVSRSKVV